MPLIRHTGPKSDDAAQKLAADVTAAPVQACAITVTDVVEKAKPIYTGRKASSDTMSKDEWAAKDRRIGRAGLYQAALQSVGVLQYSPDVRSLADYLKAVRAAAEDGLKFVSEEESK